MNCILKTETPICSHYILSEKYIAEHCLTKPCLLLLGYGGVVPGGYGPGGYPAGTGAGPFGFGPGGAGTGAGGLRQGVAGGYGPGGQALGAGKPAKSGYGSSLGGTGYGPGKLMQKNISLKGFVYHILIPNTTLPDHLSM